MARSEAGLEKAVILNCLTLTEEVATRRPERRCTCKPNSACAAFPPRQGANGDPVVRSAKGEVWPGALFVAIPMMQFSCWGWLA